MTTEFIEALKAAIPYVEAAAEPQVVYGFFHGGDPRNFSPDTESCTEAELAAHKAACEAYTSGQPLSGCCEHRLSEDGKVSMIITKAPFGIGVNSYQDEDALRALELIKDVLSKAEGR